MRHALLAALLLHLVAPALAWAQRTQGAAPAPSSTRVAANQEDDEEEEGTPATAPSAPKPPPPTPVAPLAVDERTQQLVSGAPLYNPNVAVHIVEQKQFADRGLREVVLYPAAVQLNGKFTQHAGTALAFIYHLQENFGLTLSGQYNWVAQESSFNAELINKVREEAQAATSLLLVWGAQAGVEVTPLYGKFAWYDEGLLHFSFVINGGAGLGATKHELKPENQAGPATYGDTGMKFLGSLGAGFRVQLGTRFALRLEVRDLVYTARTDAVNGCNGQDLDALDAAQRAGRPFLRQDGTPAVNVSGSCRLQTFTGIDEDGQNRANDVAQAKQLAFVPSSDVLNNIGFYAGFSFLF